ncbi:MAG: hypothetical protein ACRC1X_09200, partial [Lactobacillus panisapium]
MRHLHKIAALLFFAGASSAASANSLNGEFKNMTFKVRLGTNTNTCLTAEGTQAKANSCVSPVNGNSVELTKQIFMLDNGKIISAYMPNPNDLRCLSELNGAAIFTNCDNASVFNLKMADHFGNIYVTKSDDRYLAQSGSDAIFITNPTTVSLPLLSESIKLHISNQNHGDRDGNLELKSDTMLWHQATP